MTPIVQRMGLPQKSAATIRQMMPMVIKCASDARYFVRRDSIRREGDA
jgi:hypothetical protein